MAKQKAKRSQKTKRSPRSFAKVKVSEMVNQVKEPLSLLGTLKEEGMANAISIIGIAGSVASGATRNLRLEALRPQLKELMNSLGFALRSDLERLESRVEELEARLSEREFEAIRESGEE